MKLLIFSLFVWCYGSNCQAVPKPTTWWNLDGIKCIDSFTLHYNQWTKEYAAQVSYIRYDDGVKWGKDRVVKFICLNSSNNFWWNRHLRYWITLDIEDAIKTPTRDSAIAIMKEYIKEKKENEDKKRNEIIESRRLQRYMDSLDRVRKDFKPVKDK